MAKKMKPKFYYLYTTIYHNCGDETIHSLHKTKADLLKAFREDYDEWEVETPTWGEAKKAMILDEIVDLCGHTVMMDKVQIPE